MNMHLVRSFIVFIISGLATVGADDGSRRLFKDLFSATTTTSTGPYRALVRPVEKFGDTVTVQIGMALANIRHVNYDDNSLTTNVWIIMEWNDPTLQWKSVSYGDITQISIPVSMIWSPDVTVFNDVGETQPQASTSSGLATVNHNGKVLWVASKSLKTYCELEPKAATHVCSIRLGSWTHNLPQVNIKPRLDSPGMNLTMAKVDTSFYLTEKRWTILASSVEICHTSYQWMPKPVTELSFTIRFSATKFDGCRE